MRVMRGVKTMTEHEVQQLERDAQDRVCPETAVHNTHALTELGMPDHFYLAPGCYHTAPARNWEEGEDHV